MTLLEVMLALTITAVLLSTVYGTIRGINRSLQGLSVRSELYRAAHGLLGEMSQELASAFLAVPLHAQATTYFYVEDEESNNMPQDSLYFTTLGHALPFLALGESDQSEVCYNSHSRERHEDLILLKREDLTLDDTTCRDESMDLHQLDRPYAELPIPVAMSIHPEKGTGYRLVGFQVECFANLNDTDPVLEWDSTEQNRLPSRVRITLSFEDANKNLLPFSRTVLLRMMR